MCLEAYADGGVSAPKRIADHPRTTGGRGGALRRAWVRCAPAQESHRLVAHPAAPVGDEDLHQVGTPLRLRADGRRLVSVRAVGRVRPADRHAGPARRPCRRRFPGHRRGGRWRLRLGRGVQDLLHRSITPVCAARPVSGEGARLHGGRFNRKGRPTPDRVTSVEVALREANQFGDFQPSTVVVYCADIGQVFDGTDLDALAGEGAEPSVLTGPQWRWNTRAGGRARGHRRSGAFARALRCGGR